jgi:hypothetical protein
MLSTDSYSMLTFNRDEMRGGGDALCIQSTSMTEHISTVVISYGESSNTDFQEYLYLPCRISWKV